ncbi:MAG: hypothetical protein M3Q14_03675 [bacterium]|nr:hypothetical protein [bacterium]
MSLFKNSTKLYQNRLKNILSWIKSGQFDTFWQAIKDQFWIKTSPIRRLVRKYFFTKRRNRKYLLILIEKFFGYQKEPSTDQLEIALILLDGTTHPKSSAFIRLMCPLLEETLKKSCHFTLYDQDASTLRPNTHICIVQRTAYNNEASAKKILRFLNKNSIPLVIDNDDAFHVIDKSHPEHSVQSGRLRALNKLVPAAKQIWLSVPALVETYTIATGKVTVLPNTLDLQLWDTRKNRNAIPTSPNAPLKMIYMGTATHDADMAMLLPTLQILADKYPGSFTLTVIGVAADLPELPWLERIYQPRNGSIYPNFVTWFLEQGPFDVGLSPLVDSAFNRGKSDIKCLDYIAAGLLPIVSDVLPYQSKELDDFIVRVKNDPNAWQETLEEFIKLPMQTREYVEDKIQKGQQYIRRERSSVHAARKMEVLLQELVKKN